MLFDGLGLRLIASWGIFSWLPAPIEIHDSTIMKVVNIIPKGGILDKDLFMAI